MAVTVRMDRIHGFDAVVLESVGIRAALLPPLGGRVWELTDRVRDRQWLWHREGVPLQPAGPGADYDDVWAGGWEELFPNDAPGEFEGRKLPDHGEWWTTPWAVAEASGGAEAVVRLEAETRVRDVLCTKEFRLSGNEDTLHVSYRMVSREREPFHFLFKQHVPIALTPACRLFLPGGEVTAVNPAFGTLVTAGGPFEWPWVEDGRGHRVDLRRVPPPTPDGRDFVYVRGLPEGCCGVDDLEHGAALRMRYDLEELPYVWLFLAYGGWRDCYTAVLEPCSNMPKDLSEAVRVGQSPCLPPGDVFETHVAVTLGPCI